MARRPGRVSFDDGDEVFALDSDTIKWVLGKAGHQVFPGPVVGWAVVIGGKPEVFTKSPYSADKVAQALRDAGIQTSVSVARLS
jgi:hypothetical protein